MIKESESFISEIGNNYSDFRKKTLLYIDSINFILQSSKVAEIRKRDLLILKKDIDSDSLVEIYETLQSHLGESEPPHDYFMSLLFIDLISSFEYFLVNIAKSVVKKNPLKIGSKKISLSDAISQDKDALIGKALDLELNQMMYEKPFSYLEKYSDLLSIDKSRIETEWEVFVEAKTRRDIGVHNNWICNETYLRKNSLPENSAILGMKKKPTEISYTKKVTYSLLKIANEIYNMALEKHGKNKE